MPRKREATSKRTGTTPRKPAARKPKPKRSPQLREAAEQNLARIEELDRLYQPLRKAGEAKLETTAAGRKLLEEARGLGTELNELYQEIHSGKTPSQEGQRLAQRRREEFRERHQERYLKAYAPNARLQPSVEAVAQLLRPEMGAQTAWVSETAFLQAMLLQPKPAPDDLATATQGLGDPAPPQPFHSCLRPSYPRREEYVWAPVLGEASPAAELDGELFSWGWASSSWGIPQNAMAQAWIGGDFAVPDGITEYAVTVDYHFAFRLWGYAISGVAVSNLDVGVVIDKGDGTPVEKSPQSVSLLVVPFAGGDTSHHDGNVKIQLRFTRATSAAGTVRVMVGADGHCDAWALSGGASFSGTVFVREICLTSIV